MGEVPGESSRGPFVMLASEFSAWRVPAWLRLRLPHTFHTEWQALSTLQGQIAALVQQTSASGERALILLGNCAPAALGVLSASPRTDTAVLWFDAHADFNTPETSPSGFLDGMTVAIAVGHCWRACAPMFRKQSGARRARDSSLRAVGR